MFICLLPRGEGWERHKDGVDIPAALQAEAGAAVVHQIKFRIATAFEKLGVALGFREGGIHARGHNRQVGFQEGFPDILDEREGLSGLFLQVIKENTADAAGFVSVGDEEVVVAPAFELGVAGGVVGVARGFEGGVEVGGVVRVR